MKTTKKGKKRMTWGCAHVQDEVVGLHIQQQGGEHADGLLPTDVALVRLLRPGKTGNLCFDMYQIISLAYTHAHTHTYIHTYIHTYTYFTHKEIHNTHMQTHTYTHTRTTTCT
jgi:hypothetical protein